MFMEAVRRAVEMVGLQGVSAGVLALLLAIALYSHKVASTGHRVVHAGSTVTHDVKIVALVLAGLLVVGVISMDVGRAQEVVHQLVAFDWGRLVSWLSSSVR